MVHSLYKELKILEQETQHHTPIPHILRRIKEINKHIQQLKQEHHQFSKETRTLPLIEQSLRAIETDIQKEDHTEIHELIESMIRILVATNKELEKEEQEIKRIQRELV
jgi:hypothetical protein